jgi:hypothetical protein
MVILVHFAFVLFVVLGGLAVLCFPRLAWIHLPAAAWGILIEMAGWTCPLTPLENWLRMRAGGSSYERGFVEHYFLSVLYPTGLSRPVQIILGVLVLGVNLLIYGLRAMLRKRLMKVR